MIIIGGISVKIHREVVQAKDLSAPLYESHNRVDVVGIMTMQRIPAAAKYVYPLENPAF
jgi:hypothetical protein